MIATTAAVRERPIIFSSEMVRAILDGRKTQTRLPITPQPGGYPSAYWLPVFVGRAFFASDGARRGAGMGNATYEGGLVLYGADNFNRNGGLAWGECRQQHERWQCPWTPGHRFLVQSKTFELTSVVAERLNEVEVGDVVAEGLPLKREAQRYERESGRSVEWHRKAQPLRETIVSLFRFWWDDIPGQTYPWSSNPWVWVLSFRLAAPVRPSPAVRTAGGTP